MSRTAHRRLLPSQSPRPCHLHRPVHPPAPRMDNPSLCPRDDVALAFPLFPYFDYTMFSLSLSLSLTNNTHMPVFKVWLLLFNRHPPLTTYLLFCRVKVPFCRPCIGLFHLYILASAGITCWTTPFPSRIRWFRASKMSLLTSVWGKSDSKPKNVFTCSRTFHRPSVSHSHSSRKLVHRHKKHFFSRNGIFHETGRAKRRPIDPCSGECVPTDTAFHPIPCFENVIFDFAEKTTVGK